MMGYIDKMRVKALLALAPVLLMVAALALAPAASATTINEAGETYKATNTTETIFYPGNAFVEARVACKKSSAEFTVRGGTIVANKNEAGTGVFSTGPGSVINDVNGKPSFTECHEDSFVGGTWVENEAATTETTAGWTVAAESTPSKDHVVAIGVPLAGAVITTPAGIKLTVSPERGSSVFGRYNNATGALTVDGQIDFESNVGLPSPAQFEGAYTVAPTGAGGGFEILP